MGTLSAGFRSHLEEHWIVGKPVPLWEAVQRLNFTVTLKALLGESVKSDSVELQKAFHAFDGWFEIASSDIPHLLLWKFTSAKALLLKELRAVATTLSPKSGAASRNTGESMRDELGEEGLEYWLLAIMWAGEANAIPTLWWTLYYMSRQAKYLQKTLEQIHLVLNGRQISQLSYKELLSITSVKNALEESIRMHAPPLIVRGARQSIVTKDFEVPKGHFICLSPFWAHREESAYSQAGEWNPDRWNEASTRTAVNLAFGRGKYRCPGQSFAYCGMIVALCHIITSFDVEIKGEALIDPNNLVGMTKPLRDLELTLSPRGSN